MARKIRVWEKWRRDTVERKLQRNRKREKERERERERVSVYESSGRGVEKAICSDGRGSGIDVSDCLYVIT